ncbi:hypothetical protein HCN44_004354 [Aphidius gifuensis]|uniref:Uncharacterized protein n=1 Tax=Aphidius gifuensis TaxID=684658 RepID=A0A834Y0H8_APHGI|nr:hypothetical protein HCN44_004354 [Aphidius gifuensis]
MSGILRNTLRLVSTAKYATNNFYSRRFASSMSRGLEKFILNNKLDLKKPSDYYVIGSNQEPKFWQHVWADIRKKTFINADAANVAKIDYFIASISDAQSWVTVQKKKEKFYLPAPFNIKRNGESIKPIPTESVRVKSLAFSYENCNLHVSREGGKLKIQKGDSGETLIINHSVHIEAHQKTSRTKKNAYVKNIPSILISDVEFGDTKMIVKREGQDEETQMIQGHAQYSDDYPSDLPPNNEFIDETKLGRNETIDLKNIRGSLDLQFPMSLSIKGGPQIIHIQDLDDTFTVYHKIDIQAYKDLTIQKEFEKSKIGKNTVNLKNKNDATKEDDNSKIGKIDILLDSGNLALRTSSHSSSK